MMTSIQESDSPGELITYCLNFRTQVSVFRRPSFESIVAKLDMIVKCDDYVITPLKFHNEGIFLVKMMEPYSGNLDPLEFEVEGRFGEGQRKILIPFTKWVKPKRSGALTGTLITIVDAYSPESRHNPSTVFDNHFQGHLKLPVERECATQMHKDRIHLTGDRFIVVETEDITKLPNQIEFAYEGRKVAFKTRYKGQPWKCRRCNVDHVGGCPTLKEFLRLKADRKAKEANTIIFGDSNLRNIEEVGLHADVVCVPGGMMGDVATAIADLQPQGKELVIIAGTNEIINKNGHIKNFQQFQFHVDSAVQKLEKCFEYIKPTGVTILNPILPRTYTKETEIRRAHMAQKLQTFCANGWNNCTTTYLETDWTNLERDEDDDEHPSKKATMGLITQIAGCLPFELVAHQQHCVAENKYAGVTASAVYGCTSCFNYQRQDKDLVCQECLPKSEDHRPPKDQYIDPVEDMIDEEYTDCGLKVTQAMKRASTSTPTIDGPNISKKSVKSTKKGEPISRSQSKEINVSQKKKSPSTI